MFKTDDRKLPDISFLPGALIGWSIGACFFLLVATLAANVFQIGEQGLGYLSSVVSFLSAAAAGLGSSRQKRGAGFLTGIVTATLLITVLLTIGFLAKGKQLDPSAILSIVSFTYAGVLFGVFIRPARRGNGKRHHFS